MPERPERLTDVRVLIVDDDRDVLESFDAAFQSEGALTQIAGTGDDAVEICAGDPPDLVVLDMMLPGRSGFLALERIKGHEDAPAVIMVTANEGKRHEAYARQLGVDDYLVKPVPLEKLLARAAELMQGRTRIAEKLRARGIVPAEDLEDPDEPQAEPGADAPQ
jgi:DNA-binding response OmpR family regulator